MPKHYIRNANTELAIGIGAFIVGALLVYDAIEGRGKSRSVLARLILPG